MVPGEVIRWDNFQLQKGPGPDKARWFIALGDTGLLHCPAILFTLTTTTQVHHFAQDGKYQKRRVVRFEKTPKSPFSEDCIVDVEHDKYEIHFEDLVTYGKDIIPMGKISKAKLTEIWRIVETSRMFPPIVVKDIRRCLSNVGIK